MPGGQWFQSTAGRPSVSLPGSQMLPLCGPPCHPERGGAGATEDGGGTDAVPTDAKARPAWMRGAGGAGGSSLAKVPYHELALAPAHRRLSVSSHVPFAAMRRPVAGGVE